MTKMEESESPRTKVQILQTCFQPCDEDSRVLEVNWMKKGVKGMKYSQDMITYQLTS